PRVLRPRVAPPPAARGRRSLPLRTRASRRSSRPAIIRILHIRIQAVYRRRQNDTERVGGRERSVESIDRPDGVDVGQGLARTRWYDAYELRVARVERAHSFVRDHE